MSNFRPSYTRFKPEYESITVREGHKPLEHNLDIRKLQSRCCICLVSAIVIAFILLLSDLPVSEEKKPAPDNTNTQLIFVVAVHRHGARSGLHNYTFEKDVHWDVDPGKLLNVGFKQGFDLGKRLRDKYWSSLGYSVHAVSTDTDRTVDTANSVLLGLFTMIDTQLNNSDCSCRPTDFSRSTVECVAKCIGLEEVPDAVPQVEIWGEKSGNETILQQYDYCIDFDANKKKFVQSDLYQNQSKIDFADAFNYTKELVGGSQVCTTEDECHDIEIEDLKNIWDTMKCLSAQNGIENGPYSDLDEIDKRLGSSALWYWHQLYSVEIGSSIGGMLLDLITSDINESVQNYDIGDDRQKLPATNQGYSMNLYSAHDSTLASLLAAMRVQEWEYPNFTSSIVFEVYVSKNPSETPLKDSYVQVLYDDTLKIVGDCDGFFCPMEKFIDSLKDQMRTKGNCTRAR